MNEHDTWHEALDRLAHVADHDRVVDRMPAISRRARARRNRTVAASAAGVAAVLTLGWVGVGQLGGDSRAEEPDWADSPTPTETTPTADPTEGLVVAETTRADIDGDGASDQVELLVPEGTPPGEVAATAWLRVVTADGAQHVQVVDQPSYVWLGVTTDADDAVAVDLGNGPGQEVMVGTTGGGDSAWLQVYGWVPDDSGAAGLQPLVPEGAPEEIAAADRLAAYAELSGYTVVDGRLLSWRLDAPARSSEVTVWTWSAAGTVLVAEPDGTRCVARGELTDC